MLLAAVVRLLLAARARRVVAEARRVVLQAQARALVVALAAKVVAAVGELGVQRAVRYGRLPRQARKARVVRHREALARRAQRLVLLRRHDGVRVGEVEQLVADVYGPHWADNKKVTERALKAMDQDEDGIVSMAEFEAAVKKYHNLLLPAFSMQLKLKERSFGASWWAKATAGQRR